MPLIALPVTLSFVLLSTHAVDAQPYSQDQLTYLDAHGKETKEKKAVFLKQVVRLRDTLWETNTYNARGPLLFSIQTRTSDDNAVFNGNYKTYRPDGWADTVGHFYKGVRQGSWMVFAKDRIVWEIRYADGRILWKKDSTQRNREWDSIRAVRKSEGKPMDTVESEFPGGASAWLHYLTHTLRYPDEAVDKELMGTVAVAFNVDQQGVVSPTSMWVRQSADYWLDKEAMRVIRLSGTWNPAEQFGEKVRSYKLQPILFKLEVESPKKGRNK